MFTWLLYNTLCAVPLVALALWVRRLRGAAAVEHLLWLLVLVRLLWPAIPGDVVVGADASAAHAVVASTPTVGDRAVAWVTRRLGPSWSIAARRLALAVLLLAGAGLALREGLRVRRIERGVRRGGPPGAAVRRRVEETARELGVTAPALRVLPDAPGPFVWSLRGPLLVLPDGHAPPPRTVVAHELAHLRRRDHWTAWLELAAFALHFWNPVFWLARRRLHVAAELACDAWVVRRFPAERRSYASALVDTLERAAGRARVPRAVHAVGLDRRDFELRLRRIVARPHAPSWVRRAAPAFLFLAAVALPAPGAPSLAGFRDVLPALPDGLDRTGLVELLEGADRRLAADPADGEAWARRGFALLGLGRAAEAADAFAHQLALGFEPGKACYNRACALAATGKLDAALACLEAATEHGLPVAELARRDPDLAPLRSLPGFPRD